MKLSFTVVAASLATAWGFGVVPTAFSPKTSRASSSVVLHASRNAQKIASRTAWIKARGMASDATAGTSVEAGLMKGDDGLEYVKLVHPNGSSSEVYLFGGVVTSYKDADGTEFIAVRPDAKMDGSKPISGGLSHCWPQVRHLFI